MVAYDAIMLAVAALAAIIALYFAHSAVAELQHWRSSQIVLALTHGSSDKFYEITVAGCRITTRYGRRGTRGISRAQQFQSAVYAWGCFDELEDAKRSKGYVDGDDGCESA